MLEKYGFVYIWFDSAKSKRDDGNHIRRWYIGCHWGTEDDGYICSSDWMRDAYRRRPNDFKRRMLKTNISTKKKTINEEFRWLKLIKDGELGNRYYNLMKQKQGPLMGGVKKGTVPWNKGIPHTEEHKKNLKKSEKEKEEISKRMMGNKRFLGKHHLQGAKDKVSAARKGKSLSPEHCEKLSQSHKGYKWKTDELGKRIFYRLT